MWRSPAAGEGATARVQPQNPDSKRQKATDRTWVDRLIQGKGVGKHRSRSPAGARGLSARRPRSKGRGQCHSQCVVLRSGKAQEGFLTQDAWSLRCEGRLGGRQAHGASGAQVFFRGEGDTLKLH